MRVFTAAYFDIIYHEALARLDFANAHKISWMGQTFSRNTEAYVTGNIAGGKKTFYDPFSPLWPIDPQRPRPLQHHILPQTGKQPADVVEMMMGQNDIVDIAKIYPGAHQLTHRFVAAIHKNVKITAHDRMGWLCTS